MPALALRTPEPALSPLQHKQSRYWEMLQTAEPGDAVYLLDVLHGMVSGPQRTDSFTNAERQALEVNMKARVQTDRAAHAQGEAISHAYALLHTLVTHPEAAGLVDMAELAQDSVARVGDWAANAEAREQMTQRAEDSARLTPIGMRLLNTVRAVGTRLGVAARQPGTDVRRELGALAEQDSAFLAEGQPSFLALAALQRFAAEGRIPAVEVTQVQTALAENWIERSKLCGRGCDQCALQASVARERGCGSVVAFTAPERDADR